MSRILVAYFATLVAFLGIDAIYLATIGGRLFKETLGDIMAPTFAMTPAVLFYAIFPIGLVIFALMPAFATGRWTTALSHGAMFGFFAYFTYDMTNWATLRNWTPTLSAVDVAWGTFLGAAATTVAFLITRATVGIE